MSGKRRTTLENEVQRKIEDAIGSEPDLLLLRNSVGRATFTNERTGKSYFVPYGLGEGSPDLVGILRVDVSVGGHWEGSRHVEHRVPVAMWFCLEVKADEGELDPEQVRCHEIWRRFGAFIETVRSADEARAALARARLALCENGGRA
jgi:hypothetical protein